MKTWQRSFWRLLLGHFVLTVLTGLLWTVLMAAVGTSHHAPAVVSAAYASFYLYIPFSQPLFWPLSDWITHSGHFSFAGHSPVLQITELLVIALLNSLSAVTILLSAVRLVQFARSYPRKSSAA